MLRIKKIQKADHQKVELPLKNSKKNGGFMNIYRFDETTEWLQSPKTSHILQEIDTILKSKNENKEKTAMLKHLFKEVVEQNSLQAEYIQELELKTEGFKVNEDLLLSKLETLAQTIQKLAEGVGLVNKENSELKLEFQKIIKENQKTMAQQLEMENQNKLLAEKIKIVDQQNKEIEKNQVKLLTETKKLEDDNLVLLSKKEELFEKNKNFEAKFLEMEITSQNLEKKLKEYHLKDLIEKESQKRTYLLMAREAYISPPVFPLALLAYGAYHIQSLLKSYEKEELEKKVLAAIKEKPDLSYEEAIAQIQAKEYFQF